MAQDLVNSPLSLLIEEGGDAERPIKPPSQWPRKLSSYPILVKGVKIRGRMKLPPTLLAVSTMPEAPPAYFGPISGNSGG